MGRKHQQPLMVSLPFTTWQVVVALIDTSFNFLHEDIQGALLGRWLTHADRKGKGLDGGFPCGKLLHSCGKSASLRGEYMISMVIFNSDISSKFPEA